MRRSLPLAVVLVAAVAVPIATAGATKRKTFHFTEKVAGAQISATQAVYKINDNHVGDGAGVQTVKLNGLSGTDKEITYYKDATAVSHGTFTIGTPDAKGNAKVKGKGVDTNGTGKLKGFKSTYTYTGTFNLKTLVYKITIKGVGSTK